MGAGIGMAGGPLGVSIGAATGAAMGAGQVWLNAFTSRKTASAAEENAKLAQLAASRQSDATAYSSWLGARQTAAVSSMTSTEANAFRAKQQRIAD